MSKNKDIEYLLDIDEKRERAMQQIDRRLRRLEKMHARNNDQYLEWAYSQGLGENLSGNAEES